VELRKKEGKEKEGIATCKRAERKGVATPNWALRRSKKSKERQGLGAYSM